MTDRKLLARIHFTLPNMAVPGGAPRERLLMVRQVGNELVLVTMFPDGSAGPPTHGSTGAPPPPCFAYGDDAMAEDQSVDAVTEWLRAAVTDSVVGIVERRAPDPRIYGNGPLRSKLMENTPEPAVSYQVETVTGSQQPPTERSLVPRPKRDGTKQRVQRGEPV